MKFLAVHLPSLLVLLVVLSPCCRGQGSSNAPAITTSASTTTPTSTSQSASTPNSATAAPSSAAANATAQTPPNQSIDEKNNTASTPSTTPTVTNHTETTGESGNTTSTSSTQEAGNETSAATSNSSSPEPTGQTTPTAITTVASTTNGNTTNGNSTNGNTTTGPTSTAVQSTSISAATPSSSPTLSTESSTSTTTPHKAGVVISETNLLLTTGDSFFVELQGAANENLDGLSLVILNGTSATEIWRKYFFNDSVLTSKGILAPSPHVNSQAVASLTLVVVALYPTHSYSNSTLDKTSIDRVVFTSDPAAQLSPKLKETMLPNDDEYPVVVSTGLNSPQNMSLSRCSGSGANSGMFVVSVQTEGAVNTCNLSPVDGDYTLQLHIDGSNCQEDVQISDKHTQLVQALLAWAISSRCQCGIIPAQINGSLSCGKDLYYDFSLQESYDGQGDQAVEAFKNYSQSGEHVTVEGVTYTVINCTSKCRGSGPHHQSKKDDSTTVTVAVVLSCVALFLIILVSVILYMRGRRTGIIRQFRMTRLQEDDDMDDMDDFIGGGPSFSRS